MNLNNIKEGVSALLLIMRYFFIQKHKKMLSKLTQFLNIVYSISNLYADGI